MSVTTMNFGIVFQEYHVPAPTIKFGTHSFATMRFSWVLVTCILTISFQSTLRARWDPTFLTQKSPIWVLKCNPPSPA